MCIRAKAMIVIHSRRSRIGRPPLHDKGSASRLNPCHAKPPLCPALPDRAPDFIRAEPRLGLCPFSTGASMRDSTSDSKPILCSPASDLDPQRPVTPAMRTHHAIDISLTCLDICPFNNVTQTSTHERSNLHVRHSRTGSSSTLAAS